MIMEDREEIEENKLRVSRINQKEYKFERVEIFIYLGC